MRALLQLIKALLFSAIIFWISAAALAAPKCNQLFYDKDSGRAFALDVVSKGYLFSERQQDNLDHYLAKYLQVDWTLKEIREHTNKIFQILRENPSHSKPRFPAARIDIKRPVYRVSAELDDYTDSIRDAAEVHYNFFLKSETSVQFWLKLLGLPKKQSAERSRQLIEESIAKSKVFKRYQDRFWNTNQSLRSIKAKFRVLEFLRMDLAEQGKSTSQVDEVLWKLLLSSGWDNGRTRLLFSDNGFDRIEAARQFKEMRARLIENLFTKEAVQLKLKIGSPPAQFAKNVIAFENTLESYANKLKAESDAEGWQALVVRNLTIQEAPFRGCIGGDCSSISYFSKALDPNYIYFTITKADLVSRGHVTLVLGQATDPSSRQLVPVAFVDKIQGIEQEHLKAILNAIAISIRSQGYTLVIADFSEDQISMWPNIEKFARDQLVKLSKKTLSQFVPHPHSFQFPDGTMRYTRANNKLDVRVIEPFEVSETATIRILEF